MKGKLAKFVLRAVDFLIRSARAEGEHSNQPAHLARGRDGEKAAYFYLREQGYVIVARNFHSQRFAVKSI